MNIRAACEAICESRKFETGQGGCAAICMSSLGSSRPHCEYKERVHGEFAKKIVEAALEQLENSGDEK